MTPRSSIRGCLCGFVVRSRADLCFMQNGMLDAFLEGNGLADATQILLYLAVAKLGEAPIAA